MPARIPSPVFVGAPVVHSVVIGEGWCFWRISRLNSNPPLHRTTPRVARTVTCRPARRTLAPTTPPPSRTRLVSSVPYQRGTSASCSPLRSPIMRALPMPYIFRPSRVLTKRRRRTWSMVSGPRTVRMPRLSQRKFAWVTTRLAGVLGVRRVQADELVADDPAVDRHRLDAPATGPATRGFGVVVGVLRHPCETGGGVVTDEVHHLRAAVDVGVTADLRDLVADDRVEVQLGGLGRVDDAGVLEGVVAGTQTPPPERAVLPPKYSLFSTRRVSRPWSPRPGPQSCRRRRLRPRGRPRSPGLPPENCNRL